MTITGNSLLERHLSYMLAGFASSDVVIAGLHYRGLRDSEESLTSDAQGVVHTMANMVWLRTSDFPTLPARDSAITIDGTAYKVRSALVQGDGKHLKVEFA